MDWHGLVITKEFSINEIKVLIGEKEIVLIAKTSDKNTLYIELFAVFTYFLQKFNSRPLNIYGLFLNRYLQLIRKKFKENNLNYLNLENYIALLDWENLDTYYTDKREVESFYGIELRFEKPFNDINWDEEWLQIHRYIKKNKNQGY